MHDYLKEMSIHGYISRHKGNRLIVKSSKAASIYAALVSSVALTYLGVVLRL